MTTAIDQTYEAASTMRHARRPGPAFSLRSGITFLLCAMDRQRTRHLLRDLDERQLADIGVSRQDALDEANKPFWK